MIVIKSQNLTPKLCFTFPLDDPSFVLFIKYAWKNGFEDIEGEARNQQHIYSAVESFYQLDDEEQLQIIKTMSKCRTEVPRVRIPKVFRVVRAPTIKALVMECVDGTMYLIDHADAGIMPLASMTHTADGLNTVCSYLRKRLKLPQGNFQFLNYAAGTLWAEEEEEEEETEDSEGRVERPRLVLVVIGKVTGHTARDILVFPSMCGSSWLSDVFTPSFPARLRWEIDRTIA